MTSAYEDHGDYRMPAKAYRRRNSDYRDMWENERSAAVRGIAITEHDLPEPPNGRYANPDDPDEARAERHEHLWSVEDDGSEAAPASLPASFPYLADLPPEISGDGHRPGENWSEGEIVTLGGLEAPHHE